MTRLSVLVLDDEAALREVLSLRIADWGHDVRAVGDAQSALDAVSSARPDVMLCDLVLPGSSGMAVLARVKELDPSLPVVMMTAHGNIDGAVDAMKSGATDFLTKPLDHEMLRALLDAIAGQVRSRRTTQSLDARLDRLGETPLIGEARAMRDLQRMIGTLAASDAPAIITGESGTGKEVIARAIHAASPRRDRPFVAINAAAIPEGLVESEIFGHEQGAFTGAVRARPGCFEQADGGTLFLDELAEMPIALQPKLLRVLQDGRARRLGGARDVRFDVRVIRRFGSARETCRSLPSTSCASSPASMACRSRAYRTAFASCWRRTPGPATCASCATSSSARSSSRAKERSNAGICLRTCRRCAPAGRPRSPCPRAPHSPWRSAS
jgi:DNA-binding NtrC family response regulator